MFPLHYHHLLSVKHIRFSLFFLFFLCNSEMQAKKVSGDVQLSGLNPQVVLSSFAVAQEAQLEVQFSPCTPMNYHSNFVSTSTLAGLPNFSNPDSSVKTRHATLATPSLYLLIGKIRNGKDTILLLTPCSIPVTHHNDDPTIGTLSWMIVPLSKSCTMIKYPKSITKFPSYKTTTRKACGRQLPIYQPMNSIYVLRIS